MNPLKVRTYAKVAGFLAVMAYVIGRFTDWSVSDSLMDAAVIVAIAAIVLMVFKSISWTIASVVAVVAAILVALVFIF